MVVLQVPYADMWADDIHWYEHMFARRRFKAYFSSKALTPSSNKGLTCSKRMSPYSIGSIFSTGVHLSKVLNIFVALAMDESIDC